MRSSLSIYDSFRILVTYMECSIIMIIIIRVLSSGGGGTLIMTVAIAFILFFGTSYSFADLEFLTLETRSECFKGISEIECIIMHVPSAV